jgi:hypothetical protein
MDTQAKDLSKRYRVEQSINVYNAGLAAFKWSPVDSWIAPNFANEDAKLRSTQHPGEKFRVTDTEGPHSPKTIAYYLNGNEIL